MALCVNLIVSTG